MRALRELLFVSALATCACSRAPATVTLTAPDASAVPAPRATAPPPPSDERRCLPVVSKDCGCTYSCGVGEHTGDHWTVRHPFWKDAALRGQVTSWCVGGACTDAFAVELVCDGTCLPRPADATCHFDGAGACTSSLRHDP